MGNEHKDKTPIYFYAAVTGSLGHQPVLSVYRAVRLGYRILLNVICITEPLASAAQGIDEDELGRA